MYEGFAILTVELENTAVGGGHGLAGLGDRTAVFGFGLRPGTNQTLRPGNNPTPTQHIIA